MKIVVYACVPDPACEGKVRRARVTTCVAPEGSETQISLFSEYFAEACVDFLPGSVAHDSCSHEQSLDEAGHLTMDFLLKTSLLDS